MGENLAKIHFEGVVKWQRSNSPDGFLDGIGVEIVATKEETASEIIELNKANNIVSYIPIGKTV